MNKKFILLIALFFPALVQSAPLSEPASLRETIPVDAVGYLRIPSPWGVFSAPKGNSLAGALAHEQHVQQIQNVETSVYQNILKKAEAFTHPVLTLVFHHLRSPIEAIVLLPENAPPPFANILISAKLNFTSIEEVNNFLKKVVAKTPPLMITSEVSPAGYGALMMGPVSVLLHYDVNTQILKVMSGTMANQALFQQTLESLVPVKQHPMYELENRVDTSHQGHFQWFNLQRILPIVFGLMPSPFRQEVVPKLNKWGLLDIRGAAFGWGVRDGKGRLSVMIDAPRTGYRKFFPAISNNFSLMAAGTPKTVFSLSIPTLEWLKGFEKVFEKEAAPKELQEYQLLKEVFKQKLGFSLEDALQALGSEIIGFADEVGVFVAIRGDKQRLPEILMALKNNQELLKSGLVYETRHINGKEYHHLIMPQSLLPEDVEPEPVNNEGVAFLMELISRFKTNIYWMEEDGYLISAAIPQMLLDRQRHLARVPIQQWLQQQQRQDIRSSLFAISTTSKITPRNLYYGYLNMLNMVANLADANIDMFALPTVTELNLPNIDGTYGLQLDIADSGFALELTFETHPLEFVGMGTMAATVGILAAVAIPAYADYMKKAQVAEGIALLSGIKTLAAVYFIDLGRFPEVEEIEAVTSGKYTKNIRLLDTKDGYSAEFNDPGISGKLILRYDANTRTWTCTHEGMSEKYLPRSCK